MTLGFSTKFKDGKSNFFLEKIWAALNLHFTGDQNCYDGTEDWDDGFWEKNVKDKVFSWVGTYHVEPKLHTMREDAHDKWHAGLDIHPVINNRTANRFQFAPTIKCVSTQDVYMTYFRSQLEVTIDDKYQYWNTIDALVKNDGFHNTGQFVQWFFPKGKDVWKGKIIHWTDLKY